jgi:hypothetical protein
MYSSTVDVGGLSTPRPGRFTPGKHPVQEAGWAPGPVKTGAENLAPTGIRFPDRPALSELLYGLSYPGPQKYHKLLLYSRLYFAKRYYQPYINIFRYLKFSLRYCEASNLLGCYILSIGK